MESHPARYIDPSTVADCVFRRKSNSDFGKWDTDFGMEEAFRNIEAPEMLEAAQHPVGVGGQG